MKTYFFCYVIIFSFIKTIYAGNLHQNYATLVVDAHNGKILHEEFANKPCYPASLTKMMTIYLALEAVEKGTKKLSDPLVVSTYASLQAPSKLGLKPQETITLENAILGLIVKSANDVAVVVAENIAGSEEEFAKLMTKRAWQLGMINTVFKNASGLPNNAQKTTAYDMAKLAIALQRDFHKHYHLFAKTSFTYNGKKYKSHNHVLVKYPFANGLKTGFTNLAGFNLVTSAQKDRRKIVSVVMGGNTRAERDYQMVQLLDKYLGTTYASIFRIDNKLSASKAKIAQNKQKAKAKLASKPKNTIVKSQKAITTKKLAVKKLVPEQKLVKNTVNKKSKIVKREKI